MGRTGSHAPQLLQPLLMLLLMMMMVVPMLVATFVQDSGRQRNTVASLSGPALLPRAHFGASLQDFRARRRAVHGLLGLLRRSPEEAWPLLARQGRLQPQLGEDVPFPCAAATPGGQRSSPRPTSVHRLRPGDVDVVAAMGDSVSAGNGALALGRQDFMLEDRGHSFTAGGWGSWRQSLTLPNILKVFNPRLEGFSSATALSVDRAARFNVAEPMAFAADLVHQAKLLAARMAADPGVNVTESWKLVNVMVGANELCAACVEDDADALVQRAGRELRAALDALMALLPRTLVVVIIAPDVAMKVALGAIPPWCQLVDRFECPCVYGDRFQRQLPRLQRTVAAMQQAQLQVAALKRYRMREDFGVVAAPFLTDRALAHTLQARRGDGGAPTTDWTYFSTDCFHLSQKGHALAANALWNNLLQPDGAKSTSWAPLFESFLCPSERRPYLCTWRNC